MKLAEKYIQIREQAKTSKIFKAKETRIKELEKRRLEIIKLLQGVFE